MLYSEYLEGAIDLERALHNGAELLLADDCPHSEHSEAGDGASSIPSREEYALERVAWQIASGLAHAHEAGLTHFDVAPDNIIITPGLDAYLTDFGTSKAEGWGMMNLMGGTKPLMAPCEHGCGWPCTYTWMGGALAYLGFPRCKAVDAYELAVTLVHMYAGQGLLETVQGSYDADPTDQGRDSSHSRLNSFL